MSSEPEFPADTTVDVAELRAQLRRELRELLGWAEHVAIPDKPDPAWPEDALKLHARLLQVEAQALEAFRRSDQRRLSAFVKGINSKEGPSTEAMLWWWNRY